MEACNSSGRIRSMPSSLKVPQVDEIRQDKQEQEKQERVELKGKGEGEEE